jgi:hypothetical protein
VKFIIFVIDDLTASGTPAEMAAIDIFNEKLQHNGHWITAGGLAAPESATVIDNRNGANLETGEATLCHREENFSGFWLINADDQDAARRLAYEGSQACNRKVELRPLLGN